MVVHCETNCKRDLSNDRKKSEKSEKKRNKCNKGILYAVWWFIVKQTANEICPMIEKNQRSLKKAQQVQQRVLNRQYGGSLCNRLQRDLSND